MHEFDVIVLGAGAAGLFCAGIAGQRGLRVLLLDHADKVAQKIRISGGGRCNFTNADCDASRFVSENPDFCRASLARFAPRDFIALVHRHGIGFHEKHRGQLFCNDSAERIIAMLVAECGAGGVQRWQPCPVLSVCTVDGGFEVHTARGLVGSAQLVVATGGLSFPKLGATDFGHRLARQFGHRVIEPRPALVPLVFDPNDWAPFAALAGVSLEVAIEAGTGKSRQRFVEDLLFTHRGLSGPAVLQASTYWREGQPLHIDSSPAARLAPALRAAKAASHRQLGNQLARLVPQRLADRWLQVSGLDAATPMPQVRDRDLDRLAQQLHAWRLAPTGTAGWRKAEVTRGGVDTRELDGRNLQSRRVPGLYFIGEVVDVTGWLGGYNFQWAWASAHACALALANRRGPSA